MCRTFQSLSEAYADEEQSNAAAYTADMFERANPWRVAAIGDALETHIRRCSECTALCGHGQ